MPYNRTMYDNRKWLGNYHSTEIFYLDFSNQFNDYISSERVLTFLITAPLHLSIVRLKIMAARWSVSSMFTFKVSAGKCYLSGVESLNCNKFGVYRNQWTNKHVIFIM